MPVAFRVLTFKDTPTRYGWSKVGKGEIPKQVSEPQHYAKKDVVSGQLSIYFEDTERPAARAEILGLETLAVWAHPHLVERLEAQIEGRESAYLRDIDAAR